MLLISILILIIQTLGGLKFYISASKLLRLFFKKGLFQIQQSCHFCHCQRDIHYAYDVGMRVLEDLAIGVQCCITNNKSSGLNQLPFISSQFCRAQFWSWYNYVLHMKFYKAKIKVSTRLCSHMAFEVLFQAYMIVVEFSSLRLQDGGPCSFAACPLLGASLSSQRLPHSLPHSLFHM